jgi:hypothetical protein
MTVQEVRTGNHNRSGGLNVMVTGTSLEKANRRDDGQESADRNTRRQATPVHRETAAVRAKSDHRGKHYHGPIYPFGIEPRQPNAGQCSQQ